MLRNGKLHGGSSYQKEASSEPGLPQRQAHAAGPNAGAALGPRGSKPLYPKLALLFLAGGSSGGGGGGLVAHEAVWRAWLADAAAWERRGLPPPPPPGASAHAMHRPHACMDACMEQRQATCRLIECIVRALAAWVSVYCMHGTIR